MGKGNLAVMAGVDTGFMALLHRPCFDRIDFPDLKMVVAEGATVQELSAELRQQLAGRCLTEADGLAETSLGVWAMPWGETWDGRIGSPIPSTGIWTRTFK